MLAVLRRRCSHDRRFMVVRKETSFVDSFARMYTQGSGEGDLRLAHSICWLPESNDSHLMRLSSNIHTRRRRSVDTHRYGRQSIRAQPTALAHQYCGKGIPSSKKERQQRGSIESNTIPTAAATIFRPLFAQQRRQTQKFNTEPPQRQHNTYMCPVRQRTPWLEGKESEIEAKCNNLRLKVIEIEIMNAFTSKSTGAKFSRNIASKTAYWREVLDPTTHFVWINRRIV